MKKKRIFWMIQQLERFGGTEMVSLNIARSLKEEYEITIVSVGEDTKEHFVEMDPSFSFVSLGVPMEVVRFDEFLNKALQKHQYFKAIGLMISLVYHFFLKRGFYRKKLFSMTNEEDIIIASSLDSYLFAPKKRKLIFHFHFDAKDFLEPFLQRMLCFCEKPSRYVFLTKSTLERVLKAKPELEKKSTFIYNPSRFQRRYIAPLKNGNFVFIGRLEEQKNPELLLKVARYLKEKGFIFRIDVLGDGSKRALLEKMSRELELEDVLSFRGAVKGMEPFLMNADGQIVTSITEGFALSIIEANSYSVYTISTRCGDSIYEAIIENENGNVVDSFDAKVIGDKIIEVFSKDLEVLKKGAYQSAKRFEIEEIQKEWLSFLKTL